jgi:tRNA(His) guanylyltransferase
MNAAAIEVVRSFVDITIAYGQSDEYSFVLAEDTTLWDRRYGTVEFETRSVTESICRSSKLATSISTMFTAEYCMQWSTFFPDRTLERPFPTFDGRCVAYPKRKILR